MTRSPREDLRPWARGLPVIVLQVLMLAAFPFFMILSAIDGGMKEGWREWKDDWRVTTKVGPRIKRKKLP